jgi:hypothetical protein
VVKTVLSITPASALEYGDLWVTAHGLDAHGTSHDDAKTAKRKYTAVNDVVIVQGVG